MATKKNVQLFGTTRREIELGDFHSLKSSGGERRVKIDCRLPLSGRSMKGVPAWVAQGYEFVVKDDSYYDKGTAKDIKIDGMTLEFFTTDDVKKKMRTLNGCTMDKFSVVKVGEGEKAVIYLKFILYSPCGKEIIGWAYDHQGATCYVEMDSTQAEFTYDTEGEDEEEPADDQQEALPGIKDAPKDAAKK